MNQKMLDFCMEKGILLDKSVLEVLGNFSDFELAKNLLERVEYQYKQKMITKGFFENNLDKVYEILRNYRGGNQKMVRSFFEGLGLEIGDVELVKDVEVKESVIESGVNLLKVYENVPKKMCVKDFVRNFRNRYNTLKGILQERTELENLTSISRVGNSQHCTLIVMISDKRITKNNNVILEVEDLTGSIRAIVTKNKLDAFEKTKEILMDEVVALKCSGNGEIVFVNDIVFPDSRISNIKKSKVDESIAFVSDFHIGSTHFLEKNLMKFINWLNGDVGSESQKKEALKIKYMFVTGDSVDGVGVFPGQEDRLNILDVNEQYDVLSNILLKIRSDVQIILCPGQHDAVRVAEPQPAVGEIYGSQLKLLKNLKLVTNPSLIEVGSDVKFKVLMYHGASMHGIVNEIEALRMGKGHESPTDIVKYMLKKRHLAPSHSFTTYTPLEDEDALLIKEVPDIIATGDLHRPEIANYNGVTLIASSCWQSKTPFEEKVGNNPDPCKVPVMNMKTREIKIYDFSKVGEDG